MTILLFLILFPLLPAVLLAVVGNDTLRGLIIRASALVIGAASIAAAVQFLGKPAQGFDLATVGISTHAVDLTLFGVEAVLALAMVAMCFVWKTRQWWIPALILGQLAIVAAVEFGGKAAPVMQQLRVDDLAIIMVLIIGIIGSAIAVFGVGYMRDWVHHHHHDPDRRREFFSVMFLFLSAMFAIVLVNNLAWMFLFWEITTLASFLLIGHSRSEEATGNAFKALGLNTLGGIGFAVALLWLTMLAPAGNRTLELTVLLAQGQAAMIPACLIAFAGLAKSAQLPFSRWLLGAMVAPTPVSALLHSSTMVKAGVFIILKFAVVFHHTLPGYILALLGGLTFLMTSLVAMTQSNAKRVLAYSTIANLGLIVMCAGVGSAEAVWAGIMLLIFHAVAKALLFLTVGSVEHRIGSRDIEDMSGLLGSRRGLALCLIIGICGMFLAPFGMLISKWSCLEALAVVGDFPPILAILLAFGSAPTLVFWTQWLGKVITVAPGKIGEGDVPRDEAFTLGLLAILTLAASLCFPIFATHGVETYLAGVYGTVRSMPGSILLIMFIMLGMMLALPLFYLLLPKKQTLVAPYLAGANLPGNLSFRGSLAEQPITNSNYYLHNLLPEQKTMDKSIIVGVALLVVLAGTTFAFTPSLSGAIAAVSAAVAPAGRLELWQVIAACAGFVIGAPILGGLLAGADRILTARMQGRVGPPLLQPFWDVSKLLQKRHVAVNLHQNFYVLGFLAFTVASGCIFFAGGDLLLTIFAFTVGGIFLVLGAYAPNSPYSHIGAQRELMQMLACEPMLILGALGLFYVTGSFNVYDLMLTGKQSVVWLPGVLIGILFILTIKLRKSPFDLSTSHHGHQELVKGLTTEFSGPSLALIELAHWYENVFMLGLIWVFFAWNPWIAGAAVVITYLAEVLVDNSSARLTVVTMIRSSWATTLVFGALNIVALPYIIRAIAR